jgi:hypothetical protein
MKKAIILIITILGLNSTNAQRWKVVNDSTTYVINNLDTIVAGRFKLYKKQGQNLTTIKEFTDVLGTVVSGQERGWIRDFDFWDAQNWRVILGKSTYDGETKFYKTTDAGATWQIDTSYEIPGISLSINQMQIVDTQKAFLFTGYYFSYVLKTEDGGTTWQKWLHSIFSNHYGIFICNKTNMYLWGIHGDGFHPYMFKIPEVAINQLNYQVMCNANPDCIEAPGVVYNIDAHFQPIFNNLCNSLGISNLISNERDINFYPNPTSSYIHFINLEKHITEVSIYSVSGQKIDKFIINERIDVTDIQDGLYFIAFKNSSKIYKLIVNH